MASEEGNRTVELYGSDSVIYRTLEKVELAARRASAESLMGQHSLSQFALEVRCLLKEMRSGPKAR